MNLKSIIGTACTCLVVSFNSSAATVSVNPATQDVSLGNTITVDIVSADLVNATGGSMDIAWDPTVLTMTGGTLTDAQVNIADVLEGDGPWDSPDTSPFSDRGVLSSGLLSGLRVGNLFGATGAAAVATLTFTAIGAGSTLVTVADGAVGSGWSPPGMLYEAGTVNVVPIPAAVWLFGSGLIGLVGVARRKKA